MITLTLNRLGSGQVLLREDQFKQLIEKVRQVEEVRIIEEKSDLPIEGIMLLEDEAGAYDFLKDEREDIYTIEDLKVRYQ